jgi:quercetin dioxygenase-like cupin family protein
MNKEQFLQILKESDYPEPVEVLQAPNGHLDNHAHPFAVKALVLDGFIELCINGEARRFLAGDLFQLTFEQVHSETYGPDGVRYLASRKQ